MISSGKCGWLQSNRLVVEYGFPFCKTEQITEKLFWGGIYDRAFVFLPTSMISIKNNDYLNRPAFQQACLLR